MEDKIVNLRVTKEKARVVDSKFEERLDIIESTLHSLYGTAHSMVPQPNMVNQSLVNSWSPNEASELANFDSLIGGISVSSPTPHNLMVKRKCNSYTGKRERK